MRERGNRAWRWTPVSAMFAVSLLSYIDRNTLALLAPTILRETGLSGEQYGFIIAAFSIAYCVANPVGGKILDRAGLRRGMTVAVSCWTVASVAHAFAGGLWSFAAARAALGFGEAGAFPLGFVLVNSSVYLGHPVGRTQAFIGKVFLIPPLGWEVGYFVWGWLT